MEYRIERYKNCRRFNEQYERIYRFLLEAEKLEYNEHFHWGRFEWMHAHSYLDEDKLTSIVMFKDENDVIVGLTTYDTGYDDRVYLIHTSSDKVLLERMVDTVLEAESNVAVIKANAKDEVLCWILQEKGFEKKHRCDCILSLDLSNPLEYSMPDAYTMSPQGFVTDPWQYQLVIHKGFDNEGIPDKWEDEFLKRIPHANEDLKTFAITNNEYCAHCGLCTQRATPPMLNLLQPSPSTESKAWQKRLFTKHVTVQMHVVLSVPLLFPTKSFITELVLHFLRKCMVGKN